jgi:hypothetical protein
VPLEPRGTNFETDTAVGQLILGNENNGLRFEPHLRMIPWRGDPVDFAVGLPSLANRAPIINPAKDEVTWEDNDYRVRFEVLPPSQREPRGGLQQDIILLRPPIQPTLDLPFSSTGLNLWWQGALSSEDILRGATRPSNVINSIAAYHSTKSHTHRTAKEADQYRTGKAFHLYRFKAIDSV